MDFSDVIDYMQKDKIIRITLSKTKYKETFQNNSSFDTDILKAKPQ